jgi:YebC/PmpR family DNA-binding regulatory protein
MAGHSHWARIKRAKAVTDARRGRAWSRLSRAIIIAARNGGGDPEANLNLRYAIDAAKADNMPKDTIDRAIKKGTGELGGGKLEELNYEGYGPGGAAVLCAALTDNRNRTGPEIKKILETRGGNLGATNCVAYIFTKQGQISIPADATSEDAITELALEHGGEDVQLEDGYYLITCEPGSFEGLREAIVAAGIKPESAEVSMEPSSTVTLEGDDAERMLKLIDELEEHDDVNAVYSNFEIPEEELQRIAGE